MAEQTFELVRAHIVPGGRTYAARTLILAKDLQYGKYHIFTAVDATIQPLQAEAVEYNRLCMSLIGMQFAAHDNLIAAMREHDETFLTAKAALKYARSVVQSWAVMVNRPSAVHLYGGADLFADEAVQDQPPELAKPRRRFADDDSTFASRLAGTYGRKTGPPTPDEVGELPANSVAEIPPVRMEQDSPSGGKFWECFVALSGPAHRDAQPYRVMVRFGSTGTPGQTREVGKASSQGLAMSIRNTRIQAKKKRGYRQVARNWWKVSA